MTDNINKNKNQHNDDIEYEPKCDGKFSLSNRTKDPLPVVTVWLRGGKKQPVKIISSLMCLWDNGATNRIIKRRPTKYYKGKIGSNKEDYIIDSGTYVNLTITVSTTTQQSPSVNPTKQESQRAQLQRYFLECLL